MLRHWLEMEPLPNDNDSCKRMEVLKRGLRDAPLVVVLHNCYQYNALLKPTLKKQLNKFIESVLTGTVCEPTEDMLKLREYSKHVIKSLSQYTNSSDMRVRQWCTISDRLNKDEEFLNLVMTYTTCFDDEQTRPFIRMCLDFTVSECLKNKVYIMPRW